MMMITGVSSLLLELSTLFLALSLVTRVAISAPSLADHQFEIHHTKWKTPPTGQRVSCPEKMPWSRTESWKGTKTDARPQQWRQEFDDVGSSRGRRLMATNTTTPASEVIALLAFRSSILSDPTGALTNWTMENNSTCCSTWKGVACDEIGQVTGIDLGNITLNGTITFMIGDLVHLTFLNLSGSRIWGPWRPKEYGVQYVQPIPAGLGAFWGPIPSELMRCKNLSVVDLSFNSLDGESLQGLFTLPKLEYLRLSFNKFPRPVTLPEIPENGCRSLKNLRIAFTDISGAIPNSLSRCQNLIELILEFNELNGTIPTSLAELRQLQQLDLGHNKLTGQIPSQLGSLKNLVGLALFENNLEGHIPPSFGMLSRLQWLGLANNNLSGAIPPSLGNCLSLNQLELYNNALTGSIPPSFGLLNRLQVLYLHNNKLSGSIPPSLGNCSLLVELWLGSNATGYNNLIGTIPKEFGNLTSLEVLYLQNNWNLIGPILGIFQSVQSCKDY